MKNSFIKKLALAMTMVMVAGSMSACGGDEKAPEASVPGDSTVDSTGGDTPTTPDGTTDNTPTDQTVTAGGETLVVGYAPFSSKFSPFFALTAYDQDVASFVSLGLLGSDREGNIVLNGIEGTVTPYNGTDYTYYGIANCVVTENADGTVYYDFTMRDDIVFSDGNPMTIDDVIFSMYVYSDPTYDGAATFYALPILGMDEYRGGMDTLGNVIFAAGQDNTDYTLFTKEQQDAYWAAMPEAGEAFVKDITSYCVTNYSGYLGAVNNSEVALGMYVWGFGAPSEDGTTITGAVTGTEYKCADVTYADYWAEVDAAYGGDYQTMSDTETANVSLFACMNEVHPEFAVGVSTGASAPNIEGIQKTGDYSMRVVLETVDATAIYHLPVTIAPLHYYGDEAAFDAENNNFGFPKGDLSSVKAKTTVPLGAGPYVFESYENGVVTFKANKNYYLGCPEIETVLFKEVDESDKLTGIASGTLDISDPSMSVTVLESIKRYNSNGDIKGDVLYTSLVDNLGYGYIGINSNNVKVGDVKDSEASKNLRKAFATVFSAYRDTVINSYYGEMASVIQYPISNTSWAAPKPADDGYQLAYSVDVNGNPIYTSDMTDEQKYDAALQAAIGFFKAAGYTWDDASGKFTAAPAGAEMTYEVIIPADGVGDHPAFGILTAAKEALASIGITLEINDPSDSNYIWTVLEAGEGEMFAAAWGATVDPDMYQIYHSSNVVGLPGATGSNHYAIQDEELDALIMAARNSVDQSYRKATYKQCLDIIMDWGVEIPTYQRQNAIVFGSARVNMDTVTPDITTFWGWMNDIEKLQMK